MIRQQKVNVGWQKVNVGRQKVNVGRQKADVGQQNDTIFLANYLSWYRYTLICLNPNH